MLLVGFDDEHYIFNDPLRNKNTYYRKSAVEAAYAGLFKQAIVITSRRIIYEYHRPSIPTVPDGTKAIQSLLDDIYTLEAIFVNYYHITGRSPTTEQVVKGITNFLRSEVYNDWQWWFTTGANIDTVFVDMVKRYQYDLELYNRFYRHIHNDYEEDGKLVTREPLSDSEIGLIDLSHFAATLEAYLTPGLPNPPHHWAGWGGDLATGMADTTARYNESKNSTSTYYGKMLQEIADMTIGAGNSQCNYSDFCCDFDAYKISTYITENTGSSSHYYHLFSDALKWYYVTNKHYQKRFEWIVEELGNATGATPLYENIKSYMNGTLETAPKVGLLALKGGSPSQEVNDACCMAFKNYIRSMLGI